MAWNEYLWVGVVAALSIPLADEFGLRDVLYFPIVLYGIYGICWGLMVNRPEVLSPWLYFLLSIVLQFLGALIQANTDVDGLFGAGLSPADALFLLGHLCMITALWQFASKLHPEFPRQGFFQGWILATSLLLVGWQFLFLPTILAHGYSIGRPQVFRMVYPTLSSIEAGMLLWVWSSSEAYKSKAFMLLSAAIVSFGAGESMFHGTSYSLDVPPNINLILWLLGYVCFGAAALHPGMKKICTPRFSPESRHIKNVLDLLLPLVLLLPVTLLAIHFQDLHPATIGILAGFFLVMVLGWHELRMSIKNIVRGNQLLERQSRTDYLTGIPNRNHIEYIVGTSTYLMDRRNALLLIDIDGFKSINNQFGFHMGDLIIKAIAGRFYAESLKSGHHFARVDGDEFALLMLNIDSRRAIEAQAWQIHRLLDHPIVTNGVTIKLTCSIGLSICYAFEKVEFSSMLKESERALIWAKERQSQVEVYGKTRDIVDDKSWVLTEFRDAIVAHQFVVYYQPKVHTASRKVLGVEALVRWHHPVRGVIMPHVFMSKIEATDLVHHLFTLVLHTAARQWNVWREQGLVIGIALNAAARDIMNFDIVSEIKSALRLHEMPARFLEIEITESSALSDPSHVKHVLATLMDLGVKISIDDYGTGYSSLLYLQQLPLDFLKIDQQFIRQMRHHPSSALIVSSTMELARSLNVEVIAEGVEDDWIFQKLKSMRCYGVQGFLFSEAVVPESVVRMVRSIESAPSVVVGAGVQGT